MTQIDFFESTAWKKLERLEKWMGRIQLQMEAIREDLYITRVALGRQTYRIPQRSAPATGFRRVEQLTMYGVWDESR
jgi:hypothetical protein